MGTKDKKIQWSWILLHGQSDYVFSYFLLSSHFYLYNLANKLQVWYIVWIMYVAKVYHKKKIIFTTRSKISLIFLHLNFGCPWLEWIIDKKNIYFPTTKCNEKMLQQIKICLLHTLSKEYLISYEGNVFRSILLVNICCEKYCV